MKKIIFILIDTLLSLIIFAEPFVQIYKTQDNGLYARSEDRDIILTVEDSSFKRYKTLDADPALDFLTAVVLDAETVQRLEMLLYNKDSFQNGFAKVSKKDNIYTIDDDNLFLSFSFSVEKPSKEVIKIIEEHYFDQPSIKDQVVNHYNNNYIIRIHSSENILKPEAMEITYHEALIMATIIGDNDQWLWGIHNGRNYLIDLLY